MTRDSWVKHGNHFVKPFKTSVYNPRANGSVERTNSYIGELLRTLCHEIGSTANWIDLVPYLQSSINSAPGPTGVSANRLLFGRDFNGIGIFQSVTSSLSPAERQSLLVTVQKQLLDKLVAKTNKLNQHAVKLVLRFVLRTSPVRKIPATGSLADRLSGAALSEAVRNTVRYVP